MTGSTLAAETYAEPGRELPVIAEVDVLVVGGGPAGVGAAVGAARTGATVFLVEEMGAFGGMWTQGLVITLAGYNSWLQPHRVRVVDGVGGDWLRRATLIGGAVDHDGWVLSTDPEKMKLVADQMLMPARTDIPANRPLKAPQSRKGSVKPATLSVGLRGGGCQSGVDHFILKGPAFCPQGNSLLLQVVAP